MGKLPAPFYERPLGEYEIEIRTERWKDANNIEVDRHTVKVQGTSREDAMRRYFEKLHAVKAAWATVDYRPT